MSDDDTSHEPTVYVKVLYDYEYKDDSGALVAIQEGDEFRLLQKSSSDWWHVGRLEQDSKFFVPATYVTEIYKNIILVGSATQGRHASYSDYDPNAHTGIPTLDDPKPGPQIIDHSSDNVDGQSNGSCDNSPDYANVNRTIIQVTDEEGMTTHCTQKEEVPLYANASELYVNVDNAQESRQEYGNSTSPDKDTTDTTDWERHTDGSGREYFHNTATHKTQWQAPQSPKTAVPTSPKAARPKRRPAPKPPKKIESSNGIASPKSSKSFILRQDSQSSASIPSSPDRLHDFLTPPLSPASPGLADRTGSLPRGWKQSIKGDTGDIFYVNNINNDKWMSSVDEEGRIYYYKENSNESAWQLPPLSTAESPTTPEFEKELSLRLGRGPSQNSNKKQQQLPPPKIIDKSGFLNRTKFQDSAGKKVKKNWSQSYVKLTAAKLLFYKNNTSALPSSSKPYGKPDVALDLSTVTLQWADKDVSSKKNTMQVSGYDGNSLAYYLLRHDENMAAHEWYSSITQALYSKESGRKVEMRPTTMALDEKDGASNSNLTRKRGQSRYTIYGETVLDDKSSNIRERLVNFFRTRPKIKELQQQGILREEAVFGAHISVLCQREKNLVPSFVTQCISVIESKGLEHDGIYRVTGNLAQVQKLRFIIDQHENYKIDPAEWDLTVLTSALKLFFRELQEPIFPFKFFDKFLAASSVHDKSNRSKMIKDLVGVLPKPNYETLKVLFGHLCKVVEKSNENRMQSQNIAIVFGPTLLWPETESGKMAVTMMCQNNLVECILHDYERIFKK